MSCRYAPFVLDDEQPRPDDFAAHLASCQRCRDLASSHRSALALLGSDLPAPSEVSLVVSRVRARRRRRGLGAALVLGSVVLLLVWGPRDEAASVQPVAASAEWPLPLAAHTDRSVALLRDVVASYSASTAVETDRTYVSFGHLPALVALPRVSAMDGPPFQRALWPLSFTPKENP